MGSAGCKKKEAFERWIGFALHFDIETADSHGPSAIARARLYEYRVVQHLGAEALRWPAQRVHDFMFIAKTDAEVRARET